MNRLQELVIKNTAHTIPATDDEISYSESILGLKFSEEYYYYLKIFGVISYGPNETYGLGVKESSFLNIITAINDFREIHGFPLSFIPILDIGDGHYYMYDNSSENIIIVSLPDFGFNIVDSNLMEFLAKIIFD